ncbi:Na+/H+ antiporter subunit E [Falsigemmobacter faecalis]|uniref:Na+/H+ antiporter subunit E n=1 Tax=Falsigemmobacter faecalis TaxID=2488730 RepID=A0A3P3DGR0_9RHOB|nr:Na+/H+ antiporter subunit E [Falsigemmobacter faecalis]RRH73449.1 Na+/H+ antiporter subunit E [Falsigemmobacter faecalis]
MIRLIPHPLLSLALVFMWLLLTSFSLGHLVLGAMLGLVIGWIFRLLEPERPKLRRIWPLVKLSGIVALDILRSNIAVARLILTRGRHGKRRSEFLEVPLELKDPHALALLAMIVTATPGTAWLSHDMDSGILILHVFDLVEEDDWRTLIHNRYETLLMEAFG